MFKCMTDHEQTSRVETQVTVMVHVPLLFGSSTQPNLVSLDRSRVALTEKSIVDLFGALSDYELSIRKVQPRKTRFCQGRDG